MKSISWKDITVQQFMDIYGISKSESIDPDEKVEKVISILFNLSEKEVEELEVTTFNNYAKQCNEILKENIPGKPVRYIKVGKKKYKIGYDPTKLVHRQYVEIQFFQGPTFEETMKNIHLLMASIVYPVKWKFFVKKNRVEDHSKYASDMLNARIIDVYHTCLFFCALYLNLIEHIQGSLIFQMMEKGARKDQATQLLKTTIEGMAGSIPLKKWRISKIQL